MKLPTNLLIRFSISALLFVCSSYADTAPSSSESGKILNLSGRQRMLTQKMTKEFLFAALDHDKEVNLENAKKTYQLFNNTLYSLRDGNPELGLPPTTEARILRQIGKVDELWAQYKEVADLILSNASISDTDIAKLAELNLPLLKEMNKCVKLYERQASGSSLKGNPALAVAVNLSGKQRMLSQKMSKELLLIACGHNIEENTLLLTETYSLFDRTLKGLEHGDAILELSAEINSPEIISQLGVVNGIWSSYFPIVKAVAAGSSAGNIDLGKVAEINLELLVEMNRAVGMYEALTK